MPPRRPRTKNMFSLLFLLQMQFNTRYFQHAKSAYKIPRTVLLDIRYSVSVTPESIYVGINFGSRYIFVHSNASRIQEILPALITLPFYFAVTRSHHQYFHARSAAVDVEICTYIFKSTGSSDKKPQLYRSHWSQTQTLYLMVYGCFPFNFQCLTVSYSPALPIRGLKKAATATVAGNISSESRLEITL